MPKPDWWDESQMGPWEEGMDQPAPPLRPNQPYSPTNPYGPTGTPADLGPENPTLPLTPPAPATPPVTPAPAPTTPTTPVIPAPVPAPVTEPAPGVVTYETIYDDRGRAVGYKKLVDGVVTETKDYSDLYTQLEDVEKPKTFQDYIGQYGGGYEGVLGSDEYSALQDLIAKFNDPNTLPEDLQLATEQTAKRLGYASGDELLADIRQRGQSLAGGIGAQQGLSEQERQAYEKMTQATVRAQETRMRRTLDQVLSGATGNSTRNALMQANEYITQIRDTEIQADAQLAMMESERKMQEFDRQLELYQDMLNRGEVSDKQVLEAMRENRLAALQGYATSISTIIQANDQYLNMYQADLERVRDSADQIYNSISIGLEVDAAVRDSITDSFNQYWAQILAPLQYQQAQAEIAGAGRAESAATVNQAFSIIGMILGTALMFI